MRTKALVGRGMQTRRTGRALENCKCKSGGSAVKGERADGGYDEQVDGSALENESPRVDESETACVGDSEPARADVDESATVGEQSARVDEERQDELEPMQSSAPREWVDADHRTINARQSAGD